MPAGGEAGVPPDKGAARVALLSGRDPGTLACRAALGGWKDISLHRCCLMLRFRRGNSAEDWGRQCCCRGCCLPLFLICWLTAA